MIYLKHYRNMQISYLRYEDRKEKAKVINEQNGDVPAEGGEGAEAAEHKPGHSQLSCNISV